MRQSSKQLHDNPWGNFKNMRSQPYVDIQPDLEKQYTDKLDRLSNDQQDRLSMSVISSKERSVEEEGDQDPNAKSLSSITSLSLRSVLSDVPELEWADQDYGQSHEMYLETVCLLDDLESQNQRQQRYIQLLNEANVIEQQEYDLIKLKKNAKKKKIQNRIKIGQLNKKFYIIQKHN